MPRRNNLQKHYYSSRRQDDYDQFFERRTMYKVLTTEFSAILEFVSGHQNDPVTVQNCTERLDDIHELTGYYLSTCNLSNRKWLHEYEAQTMSLLWLHNLKH